MSVLFIKKRLTTVIIIAVVILAIATLSGTLGRGDIASENEQIIVTPVKTIGAGLGDLHQSLRLNGWVASDDIITVVPYVSGTLNELNVELGDSVSKGQVIARIDSRSYDLQLKQAEAAYLGAKSTFERVEQLFKSNATTRQNYDQAKSQYDAYKSQYELAALQASYTSITAPIDGTVLVIHSNQGSIAAPDLPILTIGDLSTLIVELNVPDKYYDMFYNNMDMGVKIFRPDFEENNIDAVISNISPVISAESRNFKIICRLSGDISGFRPGMFVYCVFNTGTAEDVYYLPNEVLGPGNSLWYVNKENDTAEKIDFKKEFSNRDYFVIPDELGGYDFIVEGQSFLTPGQRVRIK